MKEVRRQIVLTRNVHRFLMFALKILAEMTHRPIKVELQKLRNIVKSAKLVVWDDEAKEWVSASEEDRRNHIAERRDPRD